MNIKYGALQLYLGAKIQLGGPGEGRGGPSICEAAPGRGWGEAPVEGPQGGPRGASKSLAPALALAVNVGKIRIFVAKVIESLM